MARADKGLGEFDLIARLQQQCRQRQPFTSVGNGDDASVHTLPPDQSVAISSDAAVAGVHWPVDMPLHLACERAVAAALSDLAAMGATALWLWPCVMAVGSNDAAAMGEGIARAVCRYKLELAGGDTVRAGENALALTVAGSLPCGSAMRRDAAVAGDEIWLCGRTGHAALGLRQWRMGKRESPFVEHFVHVAPLLDEGLHIRQAGVRCCIDVSDGLAQDAGHIAAASGVAMHIELTQLPGWDDLCKAAGVDAASRYALAGGEDYALLFTASGALHSDLAAMATCIGRCTKGRGVRVYLEGKPMPTVPAGYRHFS